ncbi:LacI family transcriptional regulator [Oleiharenicola lentus]|uniref:LacI family transcriptional regulator n=1 Tax=Oleiharenicola lentus TaxID=2508720 RepID=A0A4Q1C5W8_9BACT|nr:LacI family DNA-binding transcriptional regulator [Oleiharenicola lentus]RXK53828.1 LacI family transcriptional regulator [Oleiharenicola lentus]
MKERVTQTDIARAAGVHNTTVSLSLRNSRLIPLETRERIQSIARSLGYSPDPALRALAAYRNACRQQRRAETLVYLTRGDTRQGWRQSPVEGIYFTAAERRATELGFNFRHMWLDEPGMNPRRLDRMLAHEGIRCLLLAPHLPIGETLDTMDWSRLCAVRIGNSSLLAPDLNQVSTDVGAIVRLALRQVLLAGYQRPGLVLPRRTDELADRTWSAAFGAEQYRRNLPSLPVLLLPDSPVECSHALVSWHRLHRPDVVLGVSPLVRPLLRQSGFEVPASVAYVDLLLQDVLGTLAGVQGNHARIGELAVELLNAQLEKNQFGLPTVPTITSVAGRWCDGASLPSRRPATDEQPAAILPANLVA